LRVGIRIGEDDERPPPPAFERRSSRAPHKRSGDPLAARVRMRDDILIARDVTVTE